MLASVAAGCGDGMPAAQAQGEVARPVTRPRVAAFAREVQLRASDFPGSTTLPAAGDETSDGVEARFADCVGSDSFPPTVAQFTTPTFYFAEGDEKAGFASHGEAAPTPYEARALIVALRKPRVWSCLRRLFPDAQEGTNDDTEVRDVSVSRLTTPLPPTRDSYAVRIGMTEIKGDQERRVYADQIRFVSGPNEVLLEAVGSPTPVNQIVEAGLMETLYSRSLIADF